MTLVYAGVGESVRRGNRVSQVDRLSKLEGREFQFTISPRGVTYETVPPPVDDLPLSDQGSVLIRLAVAEQVGWGGPELPEQPVAPGDTWTTAGEHRICRTRIDLSTEDLGAARTTTTYRVKRLRERDGYGCCEIEVESQMEAYLFKRSDSRSVTIDLARTTKGELLFDHERGLVREYKKQAARTMKSLLLGVVNPVLGERKGKSYSSYKLIGIE